MMADNAKPTGQIHDNYCNKPAIQHDWYGKFDKSMLLLPEPQKPGLTIELLHGSFDFPFLPIQPSGGKL